MKRNFLILLTVLTCVILTACGQSDSTQKSAQTNIISDSLAKVTFIELGSTSCIPCKKMQPIMKSVESRYVGQVKVIFHDVIKDKSKSQEFGIKLIPTQIFLDQNGKEITRHEGFFPEAEIDKILKAQGLTPAS